MHALALSTVPDRVDVVFSECLGTALVPAWKEMWFLSHQKWGVELCAARDRVDTVRQLASAVRIDDSRYRHAWGLIRHRLPELDSYEYHALWLRNLWYLYQANTVEKDRMYYIDRIAYLTVLSVAWQYRDQLRAARESS